MNCVLYARVSTDKQVQKDLSIPAQLELMRDFVTRQGWTVMEEFIEPGETATTLADRPVLQGMLNRIQAGSLKVDTVVSHKLNRMARNLDEYIPLRALLRRFGVQLMYVVEKVDDTPSGRLLENIMASIAQFESANLSEETKKGMRQKILTGGWPHQAPRGYVTVKGAPRSHVEVHPRVGPLVRKAFELYATGWYSIEAVAKTLARDGLLTASGKSISKADLHRLLCNPFYIGRLKWKDLDVSGVHPALISPELFEKVQSVIQKRFRAPGKRRGTPGLPLRGLAVCASCRGNISGEWHRKWAYYRCSRQSYRRELCSSKLCSAKRAHADLERICLRVQISRTVAERIRKAALKLVGDRTSRQHTKTIERAKIELTAKQMNLTEGYIAGDSTADKYQLQTEDLRRNLERLDKAMQDVRVDPKLLMSKVNERLQIATSLWDLHQQFDNERRIDLLRSVFKSVVIAGHGIVGFSLNPPFDRLISSGPRPTKLDPNQSAAQAFVDI